METVFDFEAIDISGTPVSLAQYRGKVLLVVNTASDCGFTPQFKGLEQVYQQFRDKGAVVLGFPCNQFAAQEPGTEQEIEVFCQKCYGVTFPMFSKVEVNGKNAHPLYQHLKKAAPGLLGTQAIKWNFTKFLVRKDGSVYKRYASVITPEKIARDVEKLLAE